MSRKYRYEDKVPTNVLVDRIKENQKLKERVKELKTKIWHIANCYDGNHAKACDMIMGMCADTEK